MNTASSTTPREGTTPAAPRPGKRARRRHTPGGVALGKDASHEAQRLAAALLEVLGGLRTPAQAAETLGVSQARYFQVETRALQALVRACEARPRGPGRSAEKELAALKTQHERLKQELSRHQTLLRLAQRTIGLPPPRTPADKPSGKDKSKKRPRRPVVRALRAAEALQRHPQEGPQATPAADAPEDHPEAKG